MSAGISYFLTTYGLKVIGAIIILILGRVAAGMGKNIIEKILRKSKQDDVLTSFIGSIVYVLILTFAVIVRPLQSSGSRPHHLWRSWARQVLPSALRFRAPFQISRQES